MLPHDVVVMGGICVPNHECLNIRQQRNSLNFSSSSHLCLHYIDEDKKFRVRDSSHDLLCSEEENSEAEDGRVY